MNAYPLVAPVLALAMWTHVVWAWMYATRIPAIRKLRIRMDSNARRGEQMAQLPAPVRWKADNYNHLMEQPTLFYAVALSLALMQDAHMVSVALAWGYVVLRIAHSLVQITKNHIMTRFSIFALGSLVLIALTIRAVALLLV